MEQTRFLPYARQSITTDDIQKVAHSLEQELITRGENCKQFEQELASYCHAKFCVVFSSATTALYAAFQAANVSAYDRFITTPNTFIATAAAGMRLGAKPYFVDIDRTSGNMDLEQLKNALIQPPTRGRFVIAPVHFSGIAVDMRALERLIKTPDAVVIEDAAHAIGSHYPDGLRVGSCAYSHMTIFSFHAIKTVTTGEGGAVTTNDDALYERLLMLRNSGMVRSSQDPWFYEVQEISANVHMTEMQAALGRSQLSRIEQIIEKRQNIVSWYRKGLEGTPHIRLFDRVHDAKTCHHLMVAQIDFEAIKKTRTQVMNELKAAQIGSQYHYIPLYRHQALVKSYGKQEEAFPEMERYYKEALSLPLYADLTEDDIAYVVQVVKKVVTAQ